MTVGAACHVLGWSVVVGRRVSVFRQGLLRPRAIGATALVVAALIGNLASVPVMLLLGVVTGGPMPGGTLAWFALGSL